MRSLSHLFVSSLFLFSWLSLAPGLASAEPMNFAKVDPGVYRGGAPSLDDIKLLYQMGIKTVIDLRMNIAGGEAKMIKSFDEENGAHIHYINHSLSLTAITGLGNLDSHGGVDTKSAAAAVRDINNPQNWPVYVHCTHGEDRTGLVIALYRVSKGRLARFGQDAHSSPQAAVTEWKSFGWNSTWSKRFLFGSMIRAFRFIAGIPDSVELGE